ncbi:MAG: hypothetical protein HY669_02280 [Chloroflexi bacterium]|nr:hypothetical protein [Chloroflexota bacterium]
MTFDEVSLYVDLTSGAYPNYQRLITHYTPSVIFNAADLLRALRSIVPMSRDGSGIARLSGDTDRVRQQVRNWASTRSGIGSTRGSSTAARVNQETRGQS